MKKGFSLVEIIISIAALALTCGFVLDMFLTASKLNIKARDLDHATNIAINSIEILKACDTLEEYINKDIFEKSEMENINDTLHIKKYYSKYWEQIPSYNNNAKFRLDVVCEKQNTENSFYNVKSSVMNLEKIDDKEPIVNFYTGKYLSKTVNK